MAKDGYGKERARRATLKDVALAAGVTPMTVSNVLNKREGQVGLNTQAKVLAAVQMLGYRPHAVGRRLRSRKTSAIGVLILDDVPDFLNDPFTTQVVTGLANVATDNGYSLILQGVRSDNMLQAPLLSELDTDGVCALLSGSDERRQALTQRLDDLGVPVVLVQEHASLPGMCCIRQDDESGARAVARHLIDRGARTLMMLLPAENWPAMQRREAGLRQECASSGTLLHLVRCGDESLAATQAALADAMARHGRPDAVVGGNDKMAMAALMLLQQSGIAVPGEIAVTGFNAFEFAAYATPKLTTVRSPAYEMGHRAGIELLAYFADGRFSQSDILLPVHFMQAASS